MTGGNDMYLSDIPRRLSSSGDFKWEAETSIINYQRAPGNRSLYEPHMTINWGFSRTGNVIEASTVRIVNPSQYHINAIKSSNK